MNANVKLPTSLTIVLMFVLLTLLLPSAVVNRLPSSVVSELVGPTAAKAAAGLQSPLWSPDGAQFAPRATINTAGVIIENTGYGLKNPDLGDGQYSNCFQALMRDIYHAGEDWYRVDRNSAAGAEVRSVTSGIIWEYNPDLNFDPGEAIVIKSPDAVRGSVYLVYMHLASGSLPFEEVVNGRTSSGREVAVSVGTRLGNLTSGEQTYQGRFPEYHSSGDDTHLHFEYRYFANQDICNVDAVGAAGAGYIDEHPDYVGYAEPTAFLFGGALSSVGGAVKFLDGTVASGIEVTFVHGTVVRRTVTNAQGRYGFADIFAGGATIAARSADGRLLAQRTLVLNANASMSAPDIVLQSYPVSLPPPNSCTASSSPSSRSLAALELMATADCGEVPPAADGVKVLSISSHVVTPNELFCPSTTWEMTSGSVGPTPTTGDAFQAVDQSNVNTMGAWPIRPIKRSVGAGDSYTIDAQSDPEFCLRAPAQPGQYYSYWRLRDGATNTFFGPTFVFSVKVSTETSGPCDTSAPTTTLDVIDGLAGNLDPSTGVRWWRSALTMQFSATDTGCGSDRLRTQYSLNGTEWYDVTGPVTLGVEGKHTIYYTTIDGAGLREETKSAQLFIDWTAPVQSASVLCARNSLGVCVGGPGPSGASVLRVVLRDNLSGAAELRVKLNGLWAVPASSLSTDGLVRTAELPLKNGQTTVEAVGDDVAGNSSAATDFKSVTQEKFHLVALGPDRSLRMLYTTNTKIYGDVSHTNCAVDVYSNTSLYVEMPVEIVCGGNRVSSNTSTRFTSVGSSVAVAAPAYTYEYFAGLPGATVYASSKTFSSTTPLCGIHVVNGDITLTKVVPGTGCGLTFVAKGRISDTMSGVALTAADATTGALYVAYGATSPVTISGTKTLTGMIMAPNGQVTIKGQPTITGSVYGKVVELNGTSSGTVLRWGTTIPVLEHPLPLAAPAYVPQPPPTQDGVPRLLSPSTGAVITQQPIVLHWEAVSGATSYTITVWSGGTTISKTISGTTSTSMSLTVGKTWSWRVRVAGPSTGQWSETRTLQT